MKNIKKLFLLSLLIIGTYSCSSDEPADMGSNPDNKTLILGTWSLNSRTINGVADTFTDPCTEIVAMTFTANLDYTKFERSGAGCGTLVQSTGVYTVNGNNLTVTRGQIIENFVIVSLEQNFFTISYNDGGDTIVEIYGQS